MVSDGIDRLGFLIHDAARLLRKRFEAKGSAYGLSAAQWRLLVRLVKEEGVAQARLAELLEIEPISVSRLLDRMEEGGWIERRQDASDRRVRMIFPTEKSREAFAEIKSVAGEVYDLALAGLSADEKQTLIRSLNTIIANLSEGDPPAGQAGGSKDNAT
ncbi:MarR family winged helix-turn-helix transcriptional regulator [Mesorhizobium marinum]|uniref:MarR family winged helix-turn-helix transcriptional regulator n=1 Tax=Mesorhizobium marinum TaxID=3228790 RepID=A0ABV3R2G5_9HYPH